MRKRFNFNLQKVLDYRTELEEQAQLSLAKSRKMYQDQIAKVQNLEEELGRAREEITRKENVTRDRIWLWNKYIEGLDADLKFARLTLREIAREVNARRQKLLERSKDKKVIEKLKINQKIKFRYEQEKAEQKEFDEMSVVRYKPETF
ncbi:MAG: flagellar export protein FliJ [Desulfonatronovibrio sp.]